MGIIICLFVLLTEHQQGIALAQSTGVSKQQEIHLPSAVLARCGGHLHGRLGEENHSS